MITLPSLPYAYNALEPVISEKIMRIHHTKHHAGYINKTNKILKDTKWSSMSVETILANLSKLPKEIQTPVKNNGGGHINHTLFWQNMRPPQKNNTPDNKTKQVLSQHFGSFDLFKKLFSETAQKVFGSGWAWLARQNDGSLVIYKTANQDTPILNNHTPILGIDVWEHAYYLDYLNDRKTYIEKWWSLVNWENVSLFL